MIEFWRRRVPQMLDGSDICTYVNLSLIYVSLHMYERVMTHETDS